MIGFSKPIEGTKTEGFSHIYRNSKFQKQLLTTPQQNCNTLRQFFEDIYLKKFANHKCLGKIKIENAQENGQKVEKRVISQAYTYAQTFEMAINLGSGLLNKDLTHTPKDDQALRFVGFFCKNRIQINIFDLSCILYGITTVPLYDTLGIENLTYCLDQTQLTTLICSSQTAKILNSLQDTCNLKQIIMVDPLSEDLRKQLSAKYTIFQFGDILNQGKLNKNDYKKIPLQSNKCFTFSYTSGTTGPPKAAMLSHRNFLSFLAGFTQTMESTKMGPDDVYLSHLPMAHVFERCLVMYMFSKGAFIVPYSGNILKIKEDILLVKPTLLVSVPRLFNKFCEAIVQKLGGQENVRKLIQADSPILGKVRQGFGGRLRYLFSGSAPLSVKTHELLEGIMGIPMQEGYGQTQNTAAAFVQYPQDTSFGSLGSIVGNLQFKLNDIPEMGYTADDKDQNGNHTPRGEIWLRGPSVLLRYYKNEAVTKQAVTEDGWLRTGDVGVLLPDQNKLKLIDRRKNIFKLSQGEYVACQKVQNIYVKNRFVNEAFLHGDSLQNYAVLIVVANQSEIQKLGNQLGLKETFAELCQNKQVLLRVWKEIYALGESEGLKGFEQAKNLRLQDKPFILRNIVSSTMKLQRFNARLCYKAQIADMYAEGMLGNQ